MAISPIRFFKEKKSWSLIKDQILVWYLIPYLTKVKRFGRLVVVVDGFAGCGLYQDGSEGSAFIVCRAIDKLRGKGVKAVAILIDRDDDCFKELKRNLKDFENRKIAILLHGDFCKLTPRIVEETDKCPTFFYIDPFGIKGLEFDNLKQILEKVKITSTEVLVNFNYKALLREYKINSSLTDGVMGDDCYKSVLEDSKITDDDKERKIIEMYKKKYRRFFAYVGSCPVMYKDDRMAKYYLIFATSHFDGFRLMNDRMGDIYRKFYTDGRLFDSSPESYKRDFSFLKKQILTFLKNKVNKVTRKEIKEYFMKKYFMRFKESDYNQIVTKLLEEKKINSDTGKTRINDSNLLTSCSFK